MTSTRTRPTSPVLGSRRASGLPSPSPRTAPLQRWAARLALCAALAPNWAAADAERPLVLEVHAQRLTQAELARGLHDELGADATPAEGGTLALTEQASDVVRITYRDRAGNVTVRDLQLAPDDPELLAKVSLAAANLLRSQDELVASLRALEARHETPAAPTPPPAPREATRFAFPVRPDSGLARLQRPHGDDPCTLTPVVPFGADLAPFVGTSSVPAGRAAARRVSLGLFGTYSRGTRGLGASVGLNIDRQGVCGASLGLANASLGRVHGGQLGVLNLAYGGLRGVQLGTANAATGGVTGAQLGTANTAIGDVRGGQGGVANVALGNVLGAQLGTANFALGSVLGAQLGTANVSVGNLRGVQAGVANLVVGSLAGAQLGVANASGGDAPVQLGVGNFALRDVRTQVGVLNVARKADVSVGLVSIVWRGRTTLDAWGTENGTFFAGASHGSKYVHNLYGVGVRTGSGGQRFVYTLGIGARLLTRERVTLDLDALGEQLIRALPIPGGAAILRTRLTASVFVTERIALFGAAGYAFSFIEDPGERTQAPFGQVKIWHETNPDDHSPLRIDAFPTLALGLRVKLGGG